MKWFLLIFSLLLSSFLNAKNLSLVHLKTEYTATPLGIDVAAPRFSWQMQSEEQGCRQTACQITVTDESNCKVWDSGKINSDSSLNIKYAGLQLKPRTRYHWSLTVWDNDKEPHTAASWFETGLMDPDPQLSAWSGACWIGGEDDRTLYSQYLPVFKLNVSLQLDEKSNTTRAGFIYGANDERLMNRDKNPYHLENGKDSSYILIELDIAPLSSENAALLHIFRSGYKDGDRKEIPLKSIAIPATIINEQNKYETHTLCISSVTGDTQIHIDGEDTEHFVGKINLNPLGQGGNFIAFPVIADIGFLVRENRIARFSDVQIRNYRNPSNALSTAHSHPFRIEGREGDIPLTITPDRNSVPMLRTTFSTSAPQVAKARLYITSRGIYEVYMNGQRIGNDYFNPGFTQYNKTHLYQTYDVTDYVINGKNALAALLGEGWWSGAITYTGSFWNFFGDRQSLLAKLVITYHDGKEDVIVTNPSTWTCFNDGPLIYGSFFQGEVYDASKEAPVQNWTSASYDDSGWKKAVVVDLEGNSCMDKSIDANTPPVNDYSGMLLTGQFGNTVKKVTELSAIAVEEIRPGIFVYDMGQNMAGVPKISLNGMKPGQKITLRYAEVKYPDLPEYKDNVGMIMLENIRAAMAQDIYITKGGQETINPRFTFHGYRYLEITGVDHPLPLESVKGEALSSIHEPASKYETSNAKVNRLWENIVWSARANFLSIPTDCPQRNERMGWSGDISVFSRTATFLANMPQFLRRHLLAMRDIQREDGRFPDVAPLGSGFGGMLWGSAGITVAWESYRQYDDKDMLAEHYEAMKRYIEYLIRDIDPQTKVLKEKEREQGSNLGDWLSPEYDKTEKTLLWEAYFIYDLELMRDMASVLDNKKDEERYNRLYLERKDFFNRTYLDAETGKTIFREKTIDTQTSYALPLAFNILNEKNKEAAIANFTATIDPSYSLMTGFIGTAWINKALSDNGYSDIAYRLLQQTTYPSWLYPVEQGATTIWERLNSYTHTDGFGGNNRMNSFNHYSFGAVGAWMYNYSLGIERDPRSLGFKHFILQPNPDPTGAMTYVKGHYDSMYGRIESAWEITAKHYHYHFTIPPNTSATLYLKARNLNNITGVTSKEVKYLDKKNNKFIFELQSGTYNIRVKK
jgi:alpha-L-rhamnosidase